MTPTSMQLPDTRNANQLYAFKKGYRAALEGKNLNHMPSAMRYNPAMRDYFQQGWDQAQERLAEQMEKSAGNPWRHRAAWWLIMIIGGLATGAVLIKNIQQDQQVQQPALSAENRQQSSSQPSQPPVKESELISQVKKASLEKQRLTSSIKPKEPLPQKDLANDQATTNIKETELALLTPAQRNDLTLTRQERTANASKKVPLAPVVKSDIGIKVAALATAVTERKPEGPLGDIVPKNIRKLYFFTQVESASKQTIYHRWIFNHHKMALIPLKINSNLYRTWSSKRLTSAWQGQWHIEVLNADKQVIYRHSFTYGH